MIEIWKPVVGYEGLYEVSNLGNIKSLPRNTTKGGILKQYHNLKNGYSYIGLYKNGKHSQKRVHVLVMNAFNPINKAPGYDKEHTIDHIDGNKSNNKLSNLEWCSQSENQIRAYNMGINGKSTKKVIDLDTMQVFESLTEAVESVGGKKANSVTRVCQGVRSNYRNHKFAYYDDFINGTIPTFKGSYAKESCERLWR